MCSRKNWRVIGFNLPSSTLVSVTLASASGIDPYYNALQIKYAYAITCHKAQGGQWMNVFLDIGYITEEMLGEDFYRWLYTAFTRATHHLYLVNLPDEFVE